jgi:hypothetical protein
MIRMVVDQLAANDKLEVPVDAMTAVVRGLNGMLESVQLDLVIAVNNTIFTSTNATNTSFADSELSEYSESDEPEASVKSSTTTIEGGSCPTDLFDESEELAQVISDAINKAALKAISKHVPGESPLEVICLDHATLPRLQLSSTSYKLQVSGGGLSIRGQRNTNFTGMLSMPGGASFDLPSSVNPPFGVIT